MNYGFVIDNRACIGCHACSTACKSENEVTLGVYRTWVKYTESGSYPNTQRSFQVTRCNHCANPPCVRICPTEAMYQRDDGIVEFDNSACIGCKACMQACPYDAIYIDPDNGTAAKCHYCSHRVEVGLEPSCVVVCPTHAIISGDMDDAESEISRILARARTSVRKPEQGTAPKLFYIEGNAPSMVPTAAEREQDTFMWADVRDAPAKKVNGHDANGSAKQSRSGVPLRASQPQGEPKGGPIVVGGRRAAHMVQVGYNAQHNVPWHWPVPAYLVTKGIAAGLFSLVAIAWLLGWSPFSSAAAIATGSIATIFMLITTALLVFDLEKPERFLYILIRPQWRSWLTRGAMFLIGFSTIAGAWTAAEIAAQLGIVPTGIVESLRPWLLGLGIPLAVGVIVYTAFLFGQAEGRDLWQSALLPVHLIVQAAMVGGAALVIIDAAWDVPAELSRLGVLALGVGIGFDLVVLLFGELGMSHATDVAARAANEMTHGRYKNHFWFGSIAVGHVLPLIVLFALPSSVWPIASVMTIAGLYAYEYAFVMAPQRVPNS
jgi:Fe-S-cluster-containing dehydrogenase component/formate-dependent nitrite reductase membrane component NrfD